jgi:hypothetical protein
MVSTSTKAAINCGCMELMWCKWCHCPAIYQMWNNWKMHWTAVSTKSRDINQMTAGDRAFANQAITNRMVTLLNNLENAAIQKNNIVNKLVAANKCLAKHSRMQMPPLHIFASRLHQPRQLLQPLKPAPTTVLAKHTGHSSNPNGIEPAIAGPTGTK